MAKTLSKKLFGRKIPVGELALSLISLTAGGITILQNLNLSSSLSAGIESTVTKTPINFWSLLLGVLLVGMFFLFRGKK